MLKPKERVKNQKPFLKGKTISKEAEEEEKEQMERRDLWAGLALKGT